MMWWRWVRPLPSHCQLPPHHTVCLSPTLSSQAIQRVTGAPFWARRAVAHGGSQALCCVTFKGREVSYPYQQMKKTKCMFEGYKGLVNYIRRLSDWCSTRIWNSGICLYGRVGVISGAYLELRSWSWWWHQCGSCQLTRIPSPIPEAAPHTAALLASHASVPYVL